MPRQLRIEYPGAIDSTIRLRSMLRRDKRHEP